jgi:hypothetical protein
VDVLGYSRPRLSTVAGASLFEFLQASLSKLLFRKSLHYYQSEKLWRSRLTLFGYVCERVCVWMWIKTFVPACFPAGLFAPNLDSLQRCLGQGDPRPHV